MMRKFLVALILVLFFSAVCAESQTCTSVTTTTCDPGENPQFSSSVPHGNTVKRGKAGPKGEKGEPGPAGPAGTDLSEVVAEVSARHGRQINRNSALLSELSGEISNVESEQNRRLEALASLQNGMVEKLMAFMCNFFVYYLVKINRKIKSNQFILVVFCKKIVGFKELVQKVTNKK